MSVTKSDWAKYIAEMIGTMVLTLFGCGVAVLTGGCATTESLIATALAFGLSIVAMAYVIGDISGCHINPAVSLGMLLTGRMNKKDFGFYLLFQFIGGIIGALLLYVLLCSLGDWGTITSLGQNGYGNQSYYDISIWGAFLAEVILTAVFVGTVLGVTSTQKTAAQGGLVIGLCLTFVHLMGIHLTGTSVNPARSLGPALVMLTQNSTALGQVWLFIVAPLVGAAIAAVLWKYVFSVKAAQ